MMKRETFEIARIYVPVKRRATLEPAKVEALAQDILAEGLKNPILVRPDGERRIADRFVEKVIWSASS